MIFIRAAEHAAISRFILPGHSRPASVKTVSDEADGITVTEKGRRLEVRDGGRKIWALPKDVYAQDFLYEDIDHDGEKDLLVLCWKRGRYGRHKPTWVRHDDMNWSQHIFIYNIADGTVRPKWMASDIGMDAASWEFKDGVLSITDTDGETTQWVWIHWGLELLE
ncbi:MAG: hypothetical protein K6G58_10570 [Lachnospiraceae bacterium]|nr:hypothetical protein [Lachnospiraceae bacterium]